MVFLFLRSLAGFTSSAGILKGIFSPRYPAVFQTPLAFTSLQL